MSEENEVIKHNAKYASSMKKEFEKNIKLLPEESIELKLTGLILTGKLFKQNPSYIGVTNKRFIFLFHRAFGSDYLLYIPFSAISQISITKLRLRGTPFAIHMDYKEESLEFVIIENTFTYALQRGYVGPERTYDLLYFLLHKMQSRIIDQSSIPEEYNEYIYQLNEEDIIPYSNIK